MSADTQEPQPFPVSEDVEAVLSAYLAEPMPAPAHKAPKPVLQHEPLPAGYHGPYGSRSAADEAVGRLIGYAASCQRWLDLGPTQDRARIQTLLYNIKNVLSFIKYTADEYNMVLDDPTYLALSNEHEPNKPFLARPYLAHDTLMLAFVRCNPGLLNIANLARLVDMSPVATSNARQSARKKAQRVLIRDFGDKAREQLADNIGRTARGFLLPIQPEYGEYYHEIAQAGVPDQPAYRHCRSPLFMFHAWAWGREQYARQLEGRDMEVCPYSALSLRVLRGADCPDWVGYAGQATDPRRAQDIQGLRLAIGMYYERSAIGLSDRLPAADRASLGGGAIALPVPLNDPPGAAHEVLPQWRERPTATGQQPHYTRLKTFRRIIEWEVKQSGFAEPKELFVQGRERAINARLYGVRR